MWGKDRFMAKTSEPKQLQLITSTRFTPAHLAVQQGICSWCGAPCEVEDSRPGHIRVPNCGCVKVKGQE
jgi:hypothetical protein